VFKNHRARAETEVEGPFFLWFPDYSTYKQTMESDGEVNTVVADGDGSDELLSSLVTPSRPSRPRKGKRKDYPAFSPTIDLGQSHLDVSDDEGVTSSIEVVGKKKPTLPEKQQWSIGQLDDETFDYSTLPSDYICLPAKKLFHLFGKFKCKECHATNKKEFQVERFGFAQSLYYKCSNCNVRECVRANMTSELETYWKAQPADKTYHSTNQYSRPSCADFESNVNMYLATQQCGGGRHEGQVLGGMMGIHPSALRKQWNTISEKIGLDIIELGREVMETNREIEKQLSPMIDGKYGISITGDARWDKRSSGRNYSSISGCAVTVGCRSQLVWDIEAMSNKCIKCLRGIDHDNEVCPKNVECSAKAMEAIGSSRIVLRLFESGDCVVVEYVSDDDSSTKKILRHSYADQLEKGIIDEYPRYENGKKKTDNGCLPIGHPTITWLADRNHRIRQVASKIFGLCSKKKDECIGNSHDAERIKRCVAYAVRQSCTKDAATMKAAITIAVEHHFGNHEQCGDWCRVRPLEGEERVKQALKYRNKDCKGGKKFYQDTKEIIDEFAERSADMVHSWTSDIVEGLNKFFTKFLPKDRTYGMTIENKVRLHLAICIDSVGYDSTYSRLAEKTGLEIGMVMAESHRLLDVEKQYRRKYRKRLYVKIRRKTKFYNKLRENRDKLIAENKKNLRYGSGIVGPFRQPQDQTGEQTEKRKKGKLNSRAGRGGKIEFQCSWCNLWGHQRVSSKFCKMNPANKNNEKDATNNDIPTIPTSLVQEIDEEGARQ
jgi:hypothetical protein